jgi:hypothetical protein
LTKRKDETMTEEQKQQRRDELARTIAHANSLGVRAHVCNDAEQLAESERIYTEAKRELEQLEAEDGGVVLSDGARQ